jgi:PAS domain S-box-containing protein
VRDLSLPAFSFNMLLANLVLSARASLLVTIGTCLSVTGAAAAEWLGWFSTPLSFRTNGAAVMVILIMHIALAFAARRLVYAFHQGVEKAKKQEQSYRHIFDATSEAILLLDESTRHVIDGNRSAQSMFGFDDQALKRCSLYDLMRPTGSGDEALGLVTSSDNAEPLLFEWTAKHQNGTQYPVEVSVRPAMVGHQRVFLAVVRDISERQRLQAELQESEKLQAVGQLAGGIAHDFNNQLTGILANATILESKLEDPRLKKCAELIVRCSQRSADLTSQLLAFARRGKHQDVAVDIFELVGEVVELLKHSIDKRIVLSVREFGEELQVRGDPTLLQNALLNLGLNACDAMPQGGRLQFSARRIKRSSPTKLRPGESAELEWAEIVVSDTGAGMDEATRKRAFEPFFTTKKKGNGMGLAAVYGAVESHRGEISVESQPGTGTQFTILLPITDQRRDSITLSIPIPIRKFHGTCVLFAEDEDDVAETTRLVLGELGCDVVRCRDGLEAVEMYQKSPERFDAVLLDHMMPRLSGRQALQEIRKINPQVRALLTSGYSNQTVVDDAIEAEVFLPKPFGPSQLGMALSLIFEPPKKLSEAQEIHRLSLKK